jgi:hypothetical protein
MNGDNVRIEGEWNANLVPKSCLVEPFNKLKVIKT